MLLPVACQTRLFAVEPSKSTRFSVGFSQWIPSVLSA